MTTKSMILALNSLLLFNTVSPWFGISSLRKKLVDTCAKIGKKSITLISLLLAALLVSLTVQSGRGERILNTLKKTVAPPFGASPVPTQHHVQGTPRQAFVPVQQDVAPRVSRRFPIEASAGLAAAAASAAMLHAHWSRFHQEIPEDSSVDSVMSERAIKSQFERVLEDIRNKHYTLYYLPPQLRGKGRDANLLERMPKWIVQTILQFIHQDDMYHARSFYVPMHRAEREVLEGRPEQVPLWIDSEKMSTINFIDGDPQTLELAYRPPQNGIETIEYYGRICRRFPTDVITIDTTTCSQKIEKKVHREDLSDIPTSYQQRVIYNKFLSSPSPSLLPLIQQVSFIATPNAKFIYWREGNELVQGYMHREYNFFSCDDLRQRSGTNNPLHYGIQRLLRGDKIVWALPKGKYVGIYEKEQPWYDEDSAFVHPEFKSVTQDYSGTPFHLVQVIEEDYEVQSVALPHTPVYIKDTQGNELKGWVDRPPYRATAHLRSSLDYPEHLDALALGFSSTSTNRRVSLYKQYGANLLDYHPELLLHQKSPVVPNKKDMLYPDEPATTHPNTTMYGELRRRINMAQRSIGKAVGLEPPSFE